MEVYHLITDETMTDETGRTAREKLCSILEKGLYAGNDERIYARPFELPSNMEWVSFGVDPSAVKVTNQRIQGAEGYRASSMTLQEYFSRFHVPPETKYEQFLVSILGKTIEYLPEVRVHKRRIEPNKLLRYCDGSRIYST